MSLAGSGFWIVHPLDRMRRPDTAGPSRCRTGIQIRVTRHDECLEHTAIPREVTWSCRFHGGDEPVERRRGAIFGLVQNAVEPRDRLVFAAARGNDRYRRLRSCVEGVDLEDVAVALDTTPGAGPGGGWESSSQVIHVPTGSAAGAIVRGPSEHGAAVPHLASSDLQTSDPAAFYGPGVVVLSSSVRMNGAGRVGWLLWPSTRTLPSKVTRPVAVASRCCLVLVLIRKPWFDVVLTLVSSSPTPV